MNASAEISALTRAVYWVTTTVCAIIFFITGIANLVPFDHIAHDMAHLGYPPYFLKILGSWKIATSLAILLPFSPRVKAFAYAGMFFDLSGAALSRFFAHDAVTTVFIPLMILIPVTVSYILSIKIASAKTVPLNASSPESQ
jgi:uncharacterized membrane protein YphA (DoxX/SURF4 family)